MIPPRNNRITAKEAEQICGPIRRNFLELRSGFADSVRGYVVFQDWQGEYSRMDHALVGWVDCWNRFDYHDIDLAPLTNLRRKLEAGTPLTIPEIDACLRTLAIQQKQLTRMPRDHIQQQTTTELIQIELEKRGIISKEQ